MSFAAGSQDDGIRIFQISFSGKFEGTESVGTPAIEMAHHKDAAHAADVNSVRWNPTLTGVLASASDDETIKLWQVSNSQNMTAAKDV